MSLVVRFSYLISLKAFSLLNTDSSTLSKGSYPLSLINSSLKFFKSSFLSFVNVSFFLLCSAPGALVRGATSALVSATGAPISF